MNRIDQKTNSELQPEYHQNYSLLITRIQILQTLNNHIAHNLQLIIDRNKVLNDKRRKLLTKTLK